MKCATNIRKLGIATGWAAGVRFPTGAGALDPTQPSIQRVPEAISPAGKWRGREADHSNSSTAEVKNGGATPPIPHISSWYSV
jgi:hypothetical protein